MQIEGCVLREVVRGTVTVTRLRWHAPTACEP
jgi:hypothetical protein